MSRDSLPRAARKAAVVDRDSDDSESEDETTIIPVKKKEVKLSPEEAIKRTIKMIPKETLGDLVFQLTQTGRLQPAELQNVLSIFAQKGILQLPVEILVSIVSMLPLRDRILCLRTCRLLRELGQNEAAIWRTVVFVAVPYNRREGNNPVGWIKKTTISDFLETIPEGSIRNLTIEDDLVNKTLFKEIVNSQDLVELNLIGTSFLKNRGALLRKLPTSANLKALRFFSDSDNGYGAFSPSDLLCSFVEGHPNLRSLRLGSGQFVRIKADSPRGEIHRNVTSLELYGNYTSLSDLYSLFNCFVSLKDLVLNRLGAASTLPARSNCAENEVTVAADCMEELRKDATFAALDTQASPHLLPTSFRTYHMPLTVLQDRRNRAEPAARPTNVAVKDVYAYDPQSNTFNTPLAVMSIVNDLAGGILEHFIFLATTQLVLYGTFNELRVLELALPPNDLRIYAAHNLFSLAKHRIPLVFQGFSAPKLEKLIIHGTESFDGVDEIKQIVGKDVEIVVTGRAKPEVMWNAVDFRRMM